MSDTQQTSGEQPRSPEWQEYTELRTSDLRSGDVLRIDTAEGIQELTISPDDQRKDPGIPVYQPGEPPYVFTNEIIGSSDSTKPPAKEDEPGILRVGHDVVFRFYSKDLPEGQVGIVQGLSKIEVKKYTRK